MLNKGFRKVAVGLSGGVDSAVSALMLKNKGFDVLGVFMRNWDYNDDENSSCSSDTDAEDASWVCNKLQIQFKEVSFVKEYWNHVFQDTIDDYTNGFTPNPDILCNSYIKFNSFYHYCRQQLNTDAVATGHYARSSFGPFLENYTDCQFAKLLRSNDPVKDQTFFLSRISQEALQNSMFPVGQYSKQKVKEIAHENNLSRVLQRKESMGMCFIGSKKFRSFISQYIPDKEGDFIDLETGNVIGQHKGVHYWTIGQCVMVKNSLISYYVAQLHPESNNVYVAPGHEHPALYSSGFFISDVYWIEEEPKAVLNKRYLKCKFRFQHGKPLADCTLVKINHTDFLVDTEQPVYAIAPGQFAVFYTGEECLGSGKIIHSGPSTYFAKLPEIVDMSQWERKNLSSSD